jgi:hypothetical protein
MLATSHSHAMVRKACTHCSSMRSMTAAAKISAVVLPRPVTKSSAIFGSSDGISATLCSAAAAALASRSGIKAALPVLWAHTHEVMPANPLGALTAHMRTDN